MKFNESNIQQLAETRICDVIECSKLQELYYTKEQILTVHTLHNALSSSSWSMFGGYDKTIRLETTTPKFIHMTVYRDGKVTVYSPTEEESG